VYLDEALAEQGIDLPVGLTAYLGNTAKAGFYSYTDPYGIVDDSYDWFQANNRTDYPIGLDVTYEDYTVRAMYDFVGDDSTYGPLVSVKGTPVDGIDFAASFVGAAVYVDGSSEFNVSATADIATLAGLDFDLDASFFTVFGTDASADPIFLAAVTGGMDDLSAYAEFSMNAVDYGYETYGIFAGASYALTDITSVGADMDYDVDASVLGYDAYVKSTIGGVTYKAKLYGDTDGNYGLKTQAYISF
jgi:hypothetical protein